MNKFCVCREVCRLGLVLREQTETGVIINGRCGGELRDPRFANRSKEVFDIPARLGVGEEDVVPIRQYRGNHKARRKLNSEAFRTLLATAKYIPRKLVARAIALTRDDKADPLNKLITVDGPQGAVETQRRSERAVSHLNPTGFEDVEGPSAKEPAPQADCPHLNEGKECYEERCP